MKKSIYIVVIGFTAGLINGLFGSGGGTVLVPSMVFLLGIEQNKAHATAISIILSLSILSSFFYISNGIFDLKLTYKVAIFSIIGGYIGSILLNKFSNKALRRIFGISMIIVAIRMVFY